MDRFLISIRSRAVYVAIAPLLILAVSGCDNTPTLRPDWAIVTGKVTYQGQPVPAGSIMWCVEGQTDVLRGGNIQPDGTFQFDSPIGAAKVAVHTADVKKVNPDRYVELPAKYTDPEKSGLKYEVQAGENTINIDLQ